MLTTEEYNDKPTGSNDGRTTQMTDEYIIAMLRNNVGVSEAACRAAKAAADRIEQLIAEKDAATAAAYEVAAEHLETHAVQSVSPSAVPTPIGNAGWSHDGMKYAKQIRALATPDQTTALDRLIADAVKPYVALLKRWQGLGCPNCNGDCSHANPPIYSCIMQETHAAIFAASKKGNKP